MNTVRLALGLLGLELAGCASAAPRATQIDPATLPRHGTLTVLVFFSPSCHCLAVHEPRLMELYARYRSRGVELLMVDSATTGSAERDAMEAQRRGYPFPIVRDDGARLAHTLGAQYATYSVVLDAQGRIRYRGGIDSDRSHLHGDAQLYLQDSIEDLLAGRSPRVTEGEALGCALQTW